MKNTAERGLFIVFEGLDRSGKSSQSQKLLESFLANGKKAKRINFPSMLYEKNDLIL